MTNFKSLRLASATADRIPEPFGYYGANIRIPESDPSTYSIPNIGRQEMKYSRQIFGCSERRKPWWWLPEVKMSPYKCVVSVQEFVVWSYADCKPTNYYMRSSMNSAGFISSNDAIPILQLLNILLVTQIHVIKKYNKHFSSKFSQSHTICYVYT